MNEAECWGRGGVLRFAAVQRHLLNAVSAFRSLAFAQWNGRKEIQWLHEL